MVKQMKFRWFWLLLMLSGLSLPCTLNAASAAKPARQEVMEAVKKSQAASVVLLPFLFVAGEHVAKDILGDDPESWKSELLKQKAYRLEGTTKGLGYKEGIITIYLDHLAQAMKGLEEVK
jgi:cobalamin biosynthesis Co2+ chelatase CbiK